MIPVKVPLVARHEYIGYAPLDALVLDLQLVSARPFSVIVLLRRLRPSHLHYYHIDQHCHWYVREHILKLHCDLDRVHHLRCDEIQIHLSRAVNYS